MRRYDFGRKEAQIQVLVEDVNYDGCRAFAKSSFVGISQEGSPEWCRFQFFPFFSVFFRFLPFFFCLFPLLSFYFLFFLFSGSIFFPFFFFFSFSSVKPRLCGEESNNVISGKKTAHKHKLFGPVGLGWGKLLGCQKRGTVA